MDNITHSLVGALIGQAGLKKKTGLALPALIIGANLPDVDAACFFWLDGVGHLGFRRGITHGPPAMVLLPLLLAGALWWFDKWQEKRGTRPEGRLPVHFGWLYALSFIGCLTHPALDWLNVYGVRLLEPFSSQWFYGDTLFIIDVWLWALLGFATWLSLRRERQGGEWRRPASIALSISSIYILLNGVLTGIAEQTANNTHSPLYVAIANPTPLQPWRREVIFLPQAVAVWQSADWLPWIGLDTPVPLSNAQCYGPLEHFELDSQQEAFLFWSRAPFAERAPDGSVLLRDARFYGPLARDRFTVALPDVKCKPLPDN